MSENVKVCTSAIKLEKAHPVMKSFKRKTTMKTVGGTIKEVDYRKITLYVVNFNYTDQHAMLKFEQDMDFLYYRAHANMYVQINIESPGGPVTTYSYAASLIKRLKSIGAYIIVNVDVMACSGGYMMACVADQIIANPMAFVGSIGVVSEMPDISKFLDYHGVAFNTYTAGESKRSLVPTSEHKEEDIEKFNAKLTEIHEAFIEHVRDYRELDDKYIEGDSYLAKNVVGSEAFVDAINTSADVRDLFFINGSNVMLVTTTVQQKRKRGRVGGILGKIEQILSKVQAITDDSIKLQ